MYPRKGVSIVAASAVLTLIGLAALFLLLAPRGFWGAPPEIVDDRSGVGGNSGLPDVPASGTAGNRAETDPEPMPGNSPEVAEPGFVHLTIRVVSPDGEPVVGGNFVLTSSHRPGVSASVITDANGEVTFEETFPAKRPKPVNVHFRSDDKRWGAFEAFKAPLGSTRVECVAVPLGDIEILALCDNGQMYSGTCYVSSGTIDPTTVGGFRPRLAINSPKEYRVPLQFDGANTVLATSVPMDVDLQLDFADTMIGYGSQTFHVDRSRLYPGARMVFTLVADPKDKRGLVEFDWTGYEADSPPRISVTRPGQKIEWISFADHDGPPWRSRLLYAGEYVIRIAGEPGWESPTFRIEEREVTRVVYAPVPLSRVVVRVVDSSGKAIRGALLTRNHGTYPSLDKEFKPGPNAAVTDAAGVALLREVPARLETFLIEARGYEPQVLTVEVPGEVAADLGTVTLQPAVGRINIRLVGMAEKQTYSLMLLQPAGAGVKVLKDLTTDSIVLESLPARTYVIAVVAGRGGNTASLTVTLSADNPTQDVVVDVSSLKERTMGSK